MTEDKFAAVQFISDQLTSESTMDVREVLKVVNEMLTEQVIDAYAIGGAVAASFYLEAVSTLDVDIFLTLRPEPGRLLLSLDTLYAYLKAHGGVVQSEYVVIADTIVQFLPPNSPLVQEALEHAVEHELFDVDGKSVRVRVFTAEYSAAIALETGRPKDKLRLLQFVQTEGALDRPQFDALVARHALHDRWREFEQHFLDSP